MGEQKSEEDLFEGNKHGMQDVLWSLFYGAGDTRTRAAREIRRLTKTSAKSRAYLAAGGVIVPLVSMLKSDDPDAKEAALLALLNLAVRNERPSQGGRIHLLSCVTWTSESHQMCGGWVIWLWHVGHWFWLNRPFWARCSVELQSGGILVLEEAKIPLGCSTHLRIPHPQFIICRMAVTCKDWLLRGIWLKSDWGHSNVTPPVAGRMFCRTCQDSI